jgi:hypothetical protein
MGNRHKYLEEHREDLCFIQPQSVTLFGEPIKWVDTTHLGVTRITWFPHIEQARKKTGYAGSPPEQEK